MQFNDVLQLAKSKGFSSCIDDQRTADYLKAAEIQKWLRDENKIIVEVSIDLMEKKKDIFYCVIFKNRRNTGKDVEDSTTYESALLEGINAALQLI